MQQHRDDQADRNLSAGSPVNQRCSVSCPSNRYLRYRSEARLIAVQIRKQGRCVTRAGASTLSELIILSIPFLAIPLPNSKDNHQLENAIFYEDKGYSWHINQNSLSQKKVEDFFLNILKINIFLGIVIHMLVN